jgi:DNA-binding NtrC family response regulator
VKKSLCALVVDDDEPTRRLVGEVLRGDGWNVSEAASGEQAIAMVDQQRWALVFCDVMLGGADGYAVLRAFAARCPQAKVVLMTGHGSAAGALDATAWGAVDYLLKPFPVTKVQRIASQVRKQLEMKPARGQSTEPAGGYVSDVDLVGVSEPFVEAMKLVGRVAPTNLSVLITGETGTGKEMVARAVHKRSRRASGPFVPVNCGALTETLLESELFGHERGAFTGAVAAKKGLFEVADGGTLFLDEIGETSPAMQVKLLRALQEGEIRRVGSDSPVGVDVRVVAATNRDLAEGVRAGTFRQDLLYRLNTVEIQLPPLRERRQDIMLLAARFAAAARPSGDPTPISFAPETVRVLEDYSWPGNVRELENAVERAAALADNTILPDNLPEHIRQPREAVEQASAQVIEVATDGRFVTLEELEASYVRMVLAHTGGNKQQAANILGIHWKTLDRMMTRHGLGTKGGA